MKKILLLLLMVVHIPSQGMSSIISAAKTVVKPLLSFAESALQKNINTVLHNIFIRYIPSASQQFIETQIVNRFFFLKTDKSSKTAIVSVHMRSNDEIVRLTAEQRAAASKLFKVISIDHIKDNLFSITFTYQNELLLPESELQAEVLLLIPNSDFNESPLIDQSSPQFVATQEFLKETLNHHQYIAVNPNHSIDSIEELLSTITTNKNIAFTSIDQYLASQDAQHFVSTIQESQSLREQLLCAHILAERVEQLNPEIFKNLSLQASHVPAEFTKAEYVLKLLGVNTKELVTQVDFEKVQECIAVSKKLSIFMQQCMSYDFTNLPQVFQDLGQLLVEKYQNKSITEKPTYAYCTLGQLKTLFTHELVRCLHMLTGVDFERLVQKFNHESMGLAHYKHLEVSPEFKTALQSAVERGIHSSRDTIVEFDTYQKRLAALQELAPTHGIAFDTMVETKHGRIRAIDLNIGDLVYTRSKDGHFGFQPITAKRTELLDTYLRLTIRGDIKELAPGSELWINSQNKHIPLQEILSNKEFAYELKVSDFSIIHEPKEFTVLTVDNDHNYFIAGHDYALFIHNENPARWVWIGNSKNKIATGVVTGVLSAVGYKGVQAYNASTITHNTVIDKAGNQIAYISYKQLEPCKSYFNTCAQKSIDQLYQLLKSQKTSFNKSNPFEHLYYALHQDFHPESISIALEKQKGTDFSLLQIHQGANKAHDHFAQALCDVNKNHARCSPHCNEGLYQKGQIIVQAVEYYYGPDAQQALKELVVQHPEIKPYVDEGSKSLIQRYGVDPVANFFKDATHSMACGTPSLIHSIKETGRELGSTVSQTVNNITSSFKHSASKTDKSEVIDPQPIVQQQEVQSVSELKELPVYPKYSVSIEHYKKRPMGLNEFFNKISDNYVCNPGEIVLVESKHQWIQKPLVELINTNAQAFHETLDQNEKILRLQIMDQALRLHEQLQNIDRYTIANKLYDYVFRQPEMIREESCKFTSELMSNMYHNISDPYYLPNRIKGLYDLASMIVRGYTFAINDLVHPDMSLERVQQETNWRLQCQKTMLQAVNTALNPDEVRSLVAKVTADIICDFGYGYVASLGKAATLSRIMEARQATGVLSNTDKVWRGIGTILDKPKEIINALKNAVHSTDPVYVTPEGITFTAAEVESLLEASNELKAVSSVETAVAETTEATQAAKTVATTESVEATQIAKGNAHAMQTRSKAKLAAQQAPQQISSNKVAPATTVAEVETETAQVVNTITTETTEATKTAEFLENLEVASVSPEFAQATKTMQQIETICEPAKQSILNLRQKFDLKHTMGFGKNPNRFLKWDYKHVLTPDIKIKGKNIMLSGFHHDPGYLIENSGLIRLTNKRMGPCGTYIADVWIGNRCFKDKTFFPANWSQEKIMEKTLEAYKDGLAKEIPNLTREGKYWLKGFTSEGIEIEMIITQSGDVSTYYPFEGQF